MDQIYKELKKFGKVKLNVLLSKHTTFRIGGPARFFIEIEDKNNLVELLNFLRAEGLTYMIIGGGSNLLFSDEGYEGVIIKIMGGNINLEGSDIIADAGVWLGLVLDTSIKNSLLGLEWAAGVPGTVGGAVRGNAGAMGSDTGHNISKVEVWHDGEIMEYDESDCEFAYRESVFKHNADVILSARFSLVKGEQKEIMANVKKHLDARTGKFPCFPSAGSFFKNIKIDKWTSDRSVLPAQFLERGTVPVGWVTEESGVKGLTIGGAKISDEHGNFIVNFNNATQADVLSVVEEVKTRVYNKFGIELDPEVEIVK